ncbi:MAG: hypothetical protein ACHQ4H_17455 [Ktedonobacterales bacterium]
MRVQSGTSYQTMTAPPLPRRRPGLIGDVWNGAMKGDFARTLGLAGAATQIFIGFMPFFGTLAALRDIVADLKYHDRLGCVLNTVALVPVFGGVSKTMDVLRAVNHAGHVVHVTQRRRYRR